MNKLFSALFVTSALAVSSSTVLANEQGLLNALQPSQDSFFGNLRMGYINSDNQDEGQMEGSAFGGKFGYLSGDWNGINAGATVYATQELTDNENGDFFSSESKSYSILGEAFVSAAIGATSVKAGRFEFDSPHGDTDDIRMVPNTFSGVLLTDKSLSDTTFYVAHLSQWSGIDAENPEEFNDLNKSSGVSLVGSLYEGVDDLSLQAWYYHGANFADWIYADAIYQINNLSLGVQYGHQSDSTDEDSSTDGDAYGLMASYSLDKFTISTAYNTVSGTVTNGFGGGPFFTSADDHTIDGVEDQKALTIGAEYTGFDGLTFGVVSVDFDKGNDETDIYLNYELAESLSIEFVYTDMNDDGSMWRGILNYSL